VSWSGRLSMEGVTGPDDRYESGSGSSFRDIWREAQQKSRLRNEVLAAVRAQAPGKTRQQLGDLVASERLSRAMKPLPEPILDLWIDAALAEDDPIHRARTSAEAIATLVRAGADLVRVIKDGTSKDSIEDEEERFPRARHLHSDLGHTVEAQLDPTAEEWLDEVRRTSALRFREMTSLFVTLVPTAPPQNGGEIEIEVKGRPVGRIRPEDCGAFWPDLIRPDNAPEAAKSIALLSQGRENGHPLELHVGVPIGRSPSDTLWDRVSRRDHFYLDHCLVCEEACDFFQERSAMVYRKPEGRTGAVHTACWERGEERARSEGLRWSDAASEADDE
jgi:hypothetical protein